MKQLNFLIIVALFAAIGLSGCGEGVPVVHDLGSKSYSLVNEDSTSVQFPDAYKGNYTVIGFIYTHCPDICPVTTANMKNAFNMMKDTTNVQFVGVTFDPRRDTPSVLKQYKQNFELSEKQFSMLTGDSAAVSNLLETTNFTARMDPPDTTESGQLSYTMTHSDRIAIMDPQGRIRFEYPGSKVPPEHIVEDINKLRNEAWYEVF